MEPRPQITVTSAFELVAPNFSAIFLSAASELTRFINAL